MVAGGASWAPVVGCLAVFLFVGGVYNLLFLSRILPAVGKVLVLVLREASSPAAGCSIFGALDVDGLKEAFAPYFRDGVFGPHVDENVTLERWPKLYKRQHPDDDAKRKTHIANVASQLRHQKDCAELIQKSEESAGGKYDIVVKVRDNTIALRPVAPDKLLSITEVVLKHCNWWGGVHDKVMALPRKYLEKSLGAAYGAMQVTGRVPWNLEAEESLTAAFAVSFNVLWLLSLSSYLRTHFSDPGRIPERWRAFAESTGGLAVATSRHAWQPGRATPCKKCGGLERPERAHHCAVCKVCVLRMDHHCPWTANCVGHSNYKYFLLATVYLCLNSFVAFATALPELVYCVTGWCMNTGTDGTSSPEWVYNLQRFAAGESGR
ncbi:unnamed protein product [Prorocentrum cordatum]|uniref:Palmitoyltransferase n=1 Tax=Prorocentrum cordatum TaxID=2364126 RepID=A0ABN9W6C1_9DINO|nr:unnamed protein product [Polarella glacialis]